MASEPQSHQPAGGQPVNFQGKFSVSDAGRQHVGNVYNNHTFHYEVQSRISDEKLIKGERNQVLLKAAAEGQTERVAYLINRLGVDLDYKDEQGFTALHHAALNGREEAVASLRSAGCDVNAESFNLGTPLHQAALKGRVNVVRLLLSTESTTVNASSRNIGTPLHCGASIGDCEIVSALIARGADVHLKGPIAVDHLGVADPPKQGQPWLVEVGPLFSAMYTRQFSMMELLIEKGALHSDTMTKAHLLDQGKVSRATSTQGLEKTTILMEAAGLGYTDICRLLLKKGAQIDTRGPNGKTVLHVAAQRGSRSCIELLIEKKVNLEIADDDNNTALFFAAWAGQQDCVEILVRAGSVIEAKCEYGDTAMHAAASGGHTETVRMLIRYGADPNSRNADRTTPLHLASRFGRGDIVRFLLGLKAEKDARDCKGQTPLHLSADELQLSSVEALLDNDADVNICDRAGMTALDLLNTRRDGGDHSLTGSRSDIERIKCLLIGRMESNASSTQTQNRPKPDVDRIEKSKVFESGYGSEAYRSPRLVDNNKYPDSADLNAEGGRRYSGPKEGDDAIWQRRRSRSSGGRRPPKSAGTDRFATQNFEDDDTRIYDLDDRPTFRRRSSGQSRSPDRISIGATKADIRTRPMQHSTRWADRVRPSLYSGSDVYESSAVKESPRRQSQERPASRRSSAAGSGALERRQTRQPTPPSGWGAVPDVYTDRPSMATLASRQRYSTTIRVRGRSRSRSSGRSGVRGRSRSRSRSQARKHSQSRGRSRSRSRVRTHSQPQGRSRSRSGNRLSVARKGTAVSTDGIFGGRAMNARRTHRQPF